MIRHIVMWKFRQGTEKEREKFLNGLEELQGVIPQLLRSEVHRGVGADGYDAVLIAEFRNMDELELYKKDPRHRRVSDLCRRIRVARASVDYVI